MFIKETKKENEKKKKSDVDRFLLELMKTTGLPKNILINHFNK